MKTKESIRREQRNDEINNTFGVLKLALMKHPDMSISQLLNTMNIDGRDDTVLSERAAHMSRNTDQLGVFIVPPSWVKRSKK